MNLLCVLPLVASLFADCDAPSALGSGYIEGEYVLLAPVEPARIAELRVQRGEHVPAGAVIARLESTDAALALAQAEAVAAQAQAQFEDLRSGARPEEIAVIEASLRAAQLAQQEAVREWRRVEELAARQLASEADRDRALTLSKTGAARVEELEASLAVARLGARRSALTAAENHWHQARSAVDSARWRLEQRTLKAPSDGTVSDLILRTGEMAAPTAPLVSFLPDGATNVVFYVPETALAGLGIGAAVTVRCDGCASGASATIAFIAPEPEFTPPVIYSVERRQKLVYRVEARPAGEAAGLKPGQIVDVFATGVRP